MTTNSSLQSHSSFDFPFDTEGVVLPGATREGPTSRPLAAFQGQSVATTTITFQALQGLGELSLAVPVSVGGTLVGWVEVSNGIYETFQIFRDLRLVISGPGFNKPSDIDHQTFPGLTNGLAHFQVADYNPGDLGSITVTASTTAGFQERIVPEPNTWVLFASGLAGVMLWRRRQRAVNSK
jgi:hypothetical protein